jgi:hypothetical protein
LTEAYLLAMSRLVFLGRVVFGIHQVVDELALQEYLVFEACLVFQEDLVLLVLQEEPVLLVFQVIEESLGLD